MKLYFLLSLLLVSRLSFCAEKLSECRCIGLAGNYPGFTLLCGTSTKARFPFGEDENLAMKKCEAVRVAEETGSVVKSSNCQCRVFPGNYRGIVLFHSSAWGESGIKRYPLEQDQLAANDIHLRLDACSDTTIELFNLDICQP